MNGIRSLAVGTVLLFALNTAAQQTTTSPGASAQAAMPSVEEQLKVLTGKLELTGDQQAKIKPILKDLHDTTVKLMLDKSLSQDERLDKVRPARYAAEKKMRSFLTEDQKAKLDQYEQGPHPEMHGNLSGEAQTPGQGH